MKRLKSIFDTENEKMTSGAKYIMAVHVPLYDPFNITAMQLLYNSLCNWPLLFISTIPFFT